MDLFCNYQYSVELPSTFDLAMDHGMAFNKPAMQKPSATELTDPSNFQLIAIKNSTTLDYGEVINDEILLAESDLLPLLTVQHYEPLSQDELCEAHDLGTDFSEEIIWEAMCSDLFSDYTAVQVINSSAGTGSTSKGDQSILSFCDEEINMIPVIIDYSAPEGPIMSDIDMECHQQYTFDLYPINEACLGFGEGFDVNMDSITDNNFLDYHVNFDTQEAIECSSLMEFHDSVLVAKQSEASELNNSMSTIAVGPSFEESSISMKDDSTDNWPDAFVSELLGLSDDKDLESSECVLPCSGLYEKLPDSCIMQIEDVLASEVSNTEGLTSYHTTGANNSVIMLPSNEEQHHKGCGLLKNSIKASHRQGKNRERRHRSRPRDRQLTQDRISELRGLIPNGSKCNIDKLLEQTVAHMVFLQSVPVHAEKLNQSRKTKVVYDIREDCFLIKNVRANFSYSLHVIIVIVSGRRILLLTLALDVFLKLCIMASYDLHDLDVAI